MGDDLMEIINDVRLTAEMDDRHKVICFNSWAGVLCDEVERLQARVRTLEGALAFTRGYIGIQAGSDPNALAYLKRIDAALSADRAALGESDGD